MKRGMFFVLSILGAVALRAAEMPATVGTNAARNGTGNCSFCQEEMAKATAAKEAEPQEAPAEFKRDNPLHRAADAALNEAKAHTGSAETAMARAQRLEALAAKFPDYPYRADALYYAGVNWQILKQNERAIVAFKAALQAEPEIAKETPICSYLRMLEGQTFVQRTNAGLLALLAIVLVWSLGRLLQTNPALPWGMLFTVYAAFEVIWIALILALPMLLGRPAQASQAFAAYPKPVLSDIALGELGDAPLRALLWYGAGAILATLPVVAAAATIRRRGIRIALSALGVLAMVAALLGLFGVRHCYADTQVDCGSHRIFFLIKSIATKEEVPDAMLPLYDKSFQQRILESRKHPGAAQGAKPGTGE